MKGIQASPETFESRLRQVRWHVRFLYVLTSLCIALTVTNLLILRSTLIAPPTDVSIADDSRFTHLQVLQKAETPVGDVTEDSQKTSRTKRRAVWNDYSDDVLRQRYPLPFLDEPSAEEEKQMHHEAEGSGAETGSGVWLTSYLKIPVMHLPYLLLTCIYMYMYM